MKQSANRSYPVRPSICNIDIIYIIGLGVLLLVDFVMLKEVLAKGSPSYLMHFYNSEGIRCGGKFAEDFKITYIPKIGKGETNVSYCLNKCPSTPNEVVNTIGDKTVSPVKASNLLFGYLCIPKGFDVSFLKIILSASGYAKYISDLPLYYKWLPAFIFSSIIMVLAYLVFLKYFTEYLVKFVNFMIIIGLFALAYLLYTHQLDVRLLSESAYFSGYSWAEKADHYIELALCCLGPIYFLVYFLFLREKLLISVNVVEAASDAVMDMPSTLLVSIAYMCSQLITLAGWTLIIATYISTLIGDKVEGSFIYTINFDYKKDVTAYLCIFNMVYWYWFTDCFFRFILSSMFTNWYYFQDGQHDLAGPSNSLFKATYRAFNSVGTIAIGSLIIALATSLRIVIGWATYVARSYNIERMHWSFSWVFYFVNCLAWLCEKICEQFSKYGYIHASFTGEDFFSSAWTSMCVNLSNVAIFSTVQIMQICIVWGGQISLAVLNLMCAYVLFCTDMLDLGQAKSLDQIPTGTFGAIALITFAVSSAFLSLFDEAGDAIMYCFLFDYGRNGAPPLNYPYQLKQYIQEVQKQKEKWDQEYYKKNE